MDDDRLPAATKKFSRLLEELLQLDCADLDFGIYRMLALRRFELERFLDYELLPLVESSLASAPDVALLAQQVLSDLTTFFARSYQAGELWASPRSNGDARAIPCEGGEVRLQWANAEQYYVKTRDRHTDYAALVDDVSGTKKLRLRFRLAEAGDDGGSIKLREKRRYVLRDTDPVELKGNELTVWFEHRTPLPGTGRQPSQRALCEEAEKVIVAGLPVSWKAALSKRSPRGPDKFSVLGYQLHRYTKRTSSDYFIHKDLGGYLRGELDSFIRDEVFSLDDLVGRSSADIDLALKRTKAIRAVGREIIDRLARVENFQRRLYTKKCFVLQTDWVVSMDRVPRNLWGIVVENAAQRERWRELGFTGGEGDRGDTVIRLDDLAAHPHLPVETRLFDKSFSDRVLEAQDDVDDVLQGTLIKGANYSVMRTIGRRFDGAFDFVYLDPPFNTCQVGFIYKNEYRHSSWLSMMAQLVTETVRVLPPHGLISVAIDDRELFNLGSALDSLLGESRRIGTLIVEIKPSGRTNDHFFSTSHEYYLWYAQDPRCASICYFQLGSDAAADYTATDGEGRYKWRDFLRTGGFSTPEERPNSFYPIYYRERDGHIGLEPVKGAIEILPIDSGGKRRIWRKTPPSFMEHVRMGDMKVVPGRGAAWKVRIKDRIKTGVRPKSVWVHSKYDASAHGTKLLESMFGEKARFPYPKSLHAVGDAVWAAVKEKRRATVLDSFGGSGTTAHAVIDLNRSDGGQRRYVLVEMGEHFDTVLVPRVIKANYAALWRNGRPVEGGGQSYLLRTCVVDSYDDTIENVTLDRAEAAEGLVEDRSIQSEGATLRYKVRFETDASLLDPECFHKPWDYSLIGEGAVRVSPVDLVETFNYLIGLRVKRYDTFGEEGLLFVFGAEPCGRSVVVIWRDCDLWPNERLEEKCRYALESFRPSGFEMVYVNGDKHLPVIKTAEMAWKVSRIEEAFHARMFDSSDAAGLAK